MIPGRIPGRERWEVEDKLVLSNSTDKTGELKIYAGASGEKAMAVWYGTDLVFSIQAIGTTVSLLGGSAKPVRVGVGADSSHGLTSYNDLLVVGKFEANGDAFFDGDIYVTKILRFSDNIPCVWGGGLDSDIRWSLLQTTSHTLVWGLGNDSKSVIICDYADRLKNFDHAAQSDPTIFIHSATDPDSANDEWISLCHDVTDGVIAVGSGTLNLGGSTINLVNATRTASTVSHNAYVVIEIGGTEYKFMLGT